MTMFRRLLITLCALLVTSQAFAAYAYVQKVSNSSSAAGITTLSTANLGSNPTTGDLFWYVIAYSGNTTGVTATVTDTKGNTFTQIGTFFNSTSGQSFAYGYSKNISGGSSDDFTMTLTGSGGRASLAMYVAEYSGLDTTAPYTSGETAEQGQASPGSGSNLVTSGNTPALSTQPAALIGFSQADNTANGYTVGTGFTSRGNLWDYNSDNDGGTMFFAFTEDKRLTSTSAVAATFTNSGGGGDEFNTIAAVFKETGGGPVATTTGASVGLMFP